MGVVGVRHEVNIGNNLLKYAIFIKLKELGFKPYIIGTLWKRFNNIGFIKRTTNLIIIDKNFNEIKSDDYDILMVNSDQTWTNFDGFLYDYGFLKFAENWTTPRFVYAASFGKDYWPYSDKMDQIMKNLLSKFSGISVREKDSIDIIKEHLGVIPEFVLDPTLLIDKKYYLNLIKNFERNKKKDSKYIFCYNLGNSRGIFNLLDKASKKLNFEYYHFPLNNDSLVENFLYYLINSQAVITNSFHGTVFSIIFNKPFISIYLPRKKSRINTLGNLFNVSERLFTLKEDINLDLLVTPLNINYEILKKERRRSINFLKKNLKRKFNG